MKKLYIIALMLLLCMALYSCEDVLDKEAETSVTTMENMSSTVDAEISADETTTATIKFDPYKCDVVKLATKEMFPFAEYEYDSAESIPLLPLESFSEFFGKYQPYEECFERFGIPFLYGHPGDVYNNMYYFTSDGYLVTFAVDKEGLTFNDTVMSVEKRFPSDKYPECYDN